MTIATLDSTPAPTVDVTPPTPKIDLPELPYDKTQLAKIGELDVMITEAEYLSAATAEVDSRYQALKLAAGTSLNGTTTDQVKALMTIVDGFETFERETRPMFATARSRFMAKFASDDEFSQRYRETYSEAETELDTVIADNAARRAVLSAMGHTYRNTPRTNLEWLERMMDEGVELREKAIGQVVSSAETSMMVADYKKGSALTDLLNDTRMKLELIAKLDPKNETIEKTLALIDEKEASRQKEVAEARAAYRFPSRYDATNAPSNFAELEKSLTESLEKRGYDVKTVVIASEWLSIRSALGVHMYNQIDFHVAVTSSIESEAKAGVLDVLYVTGKTGGTKLSVPFARESLGRVGQMLAENL